MDEYAVARMCQKSHDVKVFILPIVSGVLTMTVLLWIFVVAVTAILAAAVSLVLLRYRLQRALANLDRSISMLDVALTDLETKLDRVEGQIKHL